MPQLDFLLANSNDKTPIVAELKVGDDRDPFYALIQALAHATMLVTPNQLMRLRDHYPGAFSAESAKVDVYLVLVGSASGSNWQSFHQYATSLSEGLMACAPLTKWVRRIEEVALTVSAR